MAKVSVIIPTFNRGAMTVRAVQSVIEQTYADWECIVVDDASTDNTEELISGIGHDRVRYIRHETNLHASASRNTGIQAASGKYLAFLDDDDYWLPDKLEKQMNLMEGGEETLGLVYCWMDYFRDGEIVHRHHPELRGNVFEHTIDEQRMGGCPTLLVRKDLALEIGGFDPSLKRGNDGDFTRRICRVSRVDYVPEVLVHVNVGHAGITTESTKRYENGIISQETKLIKFKDELKQLPEVKVNILKKIVHFSFLSRQYSLGIKKSGEIILIKPVMFGWCMKRLITALAGQQIYRKFFGP